MLAVSSTHHSKNAETLLRAYALLEERLRTRFPLVFCCHLDEAGRALVLTLAESLGITDDVIVTGMVTDLELAALYNAGHRPGAPVPLRGLRAPGAGGHAVRHAGGHDHRVLPARGGAATPPCSSTRRTRWRWPTPLPVCSGTPIAGRRWRGPGWPTPAGSPAKPWKGDAGELPPHCRGRAPSRVHRSRSRSRRRPRAGCAWRCGRRCRPNRPAFPITPSSCSPASPATSTSRSSSTTASCPTST